MKPAIKWLGLGAAALLAAGIFTFGRGPNPRPEAVAPTVTRSRPATPVETIIVRPELLTEDVQSTGTLHAADGVDLHVEGAGVVVELALNEGLSVRQGDVLLRLDDSELKAQLQRAERRRDLSRYRERRLTRLAAAGAVTELESDEARGELAVLESEIELIQTQLTKRVLRAPFDGVIGLRFVSVGSYLTPTSRIATLQAIDTLTVDFSLPEKYADRVAAGQPIELHLASLADPVNAEIFAIDPRIDETTRTLLVRARLLHPSGRLLPGAFARVVWQAASTPDALLVPSVAVMAGSHDSNLFVVKDGKAAQRTVEIGARHAERVQVLSGLSPNDEVIVAGTQQVKSGAAVSVAQP